MNEILQQEEKVAAAFGDQSKTFDEVYGSNSIIAYKRDRVRQHVLKLVPIGASILELNAGTGEDAIFFAEKGYQVHATDLSEDMLDKLKEKIKSRQLTDRISVEHCTYHELALLKNIGPYDLIFSNFAGLNCSDELPRIFDSFDALLKPGGTVTLVLLPKFCLWESMLLFKGKFKTATRRFFSKNGRAAKINGHGFSCWYHAPSYVASLLREKFTRVDLEGLCTIVPPSYLENFNDKYPRLFKFLIKKENSLKRSWPWKYIGDYYISSFKKKT